MALSLSDLLTEITSNQTFARLISLLQVYEFPVTDWETGGTERTRFRAFSKALSDLVSSVIPVVAGGGFLGFANRIWTKVLAEQWYDLPFNEASRTVGTMQLACVSTAGPYTIVAGQLIAKFSSGNRYINTTGGTLATSGTLDLEWQSETTNDSAADLNYVDPSNGTITLVTPLPGVTITNPADDYSENPVPATVGPSSGTVALSGTPGGQYQITIRIDSDGQAGVSSWSYSINGGVFVTAGAGATLSDIGSSGIDVTLTNGANSPSFITGSEFTFAAPGTWIITQGTDEEATTAIATRCRDRWPSLASLAASSPTLGFYDLLAREASSQVTQTRVQTDDDINNKVDVIVAGQGGVLPVAVVVEIQEYLLARVPLTDFPVVTSPTEVVITLAGTATVEAGKRAVAQALAEAAVRTYINTTVGINGTIRLAEIVDRFMEIDGMTDLTGLTINGSAANLALPTIAGAFQLPSWVQSIDVALTWINGS